MTSPQPLSKGEGIEPSTSKHLNEWVEFYSDNSDYFSIVGEAMDINIYYQCCTKIAGSS